MPEIVTGHDLKLAFDRHPLDAAQAQRDADARRILRDAAGALLGVVPAGAEQATMIAKLQEAAHWACTAIAKRAALDAERREGPW